MFIESGGDVPTSLSDIIILATCAREFVDSRSGIMIMPVLVSLGEAFFHSTR